MFWREGWSMSIGSVGSFCGEVCGTVPMVLLGALVWGSSVDALDALSSPRHVFASSCNVFVTTSSLMMASSRLASRSISSFRNARLQPVQYFDIPGDVMARKVRAQRAGSVSFCGR